MRTIPLVDWNTFATLYCERQQQTPDNLLAVLQAQRADFNPEGWLLLECQVLDSSFVGQFTILPYGPNNTFTTIPLQPVSPRGLASDMSTVHSILLVKELP